MSRIEEKNIIEVLTLGNTFTISQNDEFITTLQIVTCEDLMNSSFEYKDRIMKKRKYNEFINSMVDFLRINEKWENIPVNDELTCVEEFFESSMTGYSRVEAENFVMIQRKYKIASPLTEKSHRIIEKERNEDKKNIGSYFMIDLNKDSKLMVEIITYEDIKDRQEILNFFEEEELYEMNFKYSDNQNEKLMEIFFFGDYIEEVTKSYKEKASEILKKDEAVFFSGDFVEVGKILPYNYKNTSKNLKSFVFLVLRELRTKDHEPAKSIFT